MKNDSRSYERNLCNCVRWLKKIQAFKGVWTRDLVIPERCDLTNWLAMKPRLILGAGQLYVFICSLEKDECEMYNREDHSSFDFISAVLNYTWFISYTSHIHLFYMKIWTHYSPAPNISGFLAQLVRASHRSVWRGHGFKSVEVLNFFQPSYTIA